MVVAMLTSHADRSLYGITNNQVQDCAQNATFATSDWRLAICWLRYVSGDTVMVPSL